MAIQATQTNALLSGWQVLKPSKMKDLFAAKGKQGGDYYLMIRALGWSKEVDQETYSHWEEDYIIENFRTRNAVTGHGAGDSIDVTLHADDLDTANRFYPVVGDELLLGNGSSRVVGVITVIDVSTPTAPVLTIEPKDTADTLPDLNAGDYLFTFSNSHGEGTGQPDPRISGVDEYYNHLKIIKHDIKATGTAYTDGLWFNIPWATMGVTDAPQGSYYRKAVVDLDHRMAQSIGGALQFDVLTDNAAVIDPVYLTTREGTLGVFPAIGLYGYQEDYTIGTMTIGDFNEYGRIFVREQVTEAEIMANVGYGLHTEIEDLLVDYIGNTDVDYTRKRVTNQLMGGSSETEVAISFSYFKKGGRTYMFKVNYDFSNEKTYGTTGYNYEHLGMLIPMGKSKDARTGDMVPSIGYRYKKKGNYSREMYLWDTGSVDMANPTNDVDEKRTHARAHIGAQQIAVNRFISLEPTA